MNATALSIGCEAGFTIGNGLRAAGIHSLFAYDIAHETTDRGPLIASRAAMAGASIVSSSDALARSADVIFSTVTCSAALDAARQTAPFLTSRHIYADLNSVSPSLKRDMADVITGTGAAFVEAAVMAPVQPYGQSVPMLVGGQVCGSRGDRAIEGARGARGAIGARGARGAKGARGAGCNCTSHRPFQLTRTSRTDQRSVDRTPCTYLQTKFAASSVLPDPL